MGVKAVYVWAGLLVPTTVLLWFFYPEVSIPSNHEGSKLINIRHMLEPIGSLMSFMSEGSPLGGLNKPLLPQTKVETKTQPSWLVEAARHRSIKPSNEVPEKSLSQAQVAFGLKYGIRLCVLVRWSGFQESSQVDRELSR